jgi:uncharacterized membrane protein
LTARACFTLALLALACGPPNDDFDGGPPTPTGATCPPASTVTYDSFGRAFFDAYCQTCHASTVTGVDRRGAPAPITYDTVEEIRSDAARIDRHAAAGPDAVNGDMPRADPRPTLEERYTLGEWLACGAP